MKVATTLNERDHLELFVLIDETVYTSRQTGSETEWTDWEQLVGAEGKAIAAGRNEDGRPEVFLTDPADGTYHNRREPLGTDEAATEWGGWRLLSDDPITGESIAVAPNGDRRLEVFVTGPASGTFHAKQTSPNDTTWTGWEQLGDQAGNEIVVQQAANERLHAFLLSYDDEATDLTAAEKEFLFGIHHCWQLELDGDEWADWHRRGRANGHSLAVAENNDGKFEIFLVRDDETPLYLQQLGFEETEWEEEWSELSYPERFQVFHRPKAKSLAVGRHADGRLEAFITGKRLHHLSQMAPNGDWSLWERFGRVKCAGLSVTRTADERLVVFGLEDMPEVSRQPKIHQRWETEPNGKWSKWHSRTI